MNRNRAEIDGANWATERGGFADYTDLRMEASIEAEQRFGSDATDLEQANIAQGFRMGAMSVRKDVCSRKGF